jgi:hypothetical protein
MWSSYDFLLTVDLERHEVTRGRAMRAKRGSGGGLGDGWERAHHEHDRG